MTLAEVYPRLFQAGARSLEKVPLAERIRACVGYDITVVVNVDNGKKGDPARGRDDEFAFNFFGEYLHVPIGDNSTIAEDLADVQQAVHKAALAIRSGHAALTHCRYGVNRSGFVNALIIRELEQCTGAEALAMLRQRRPGAVKGNHHAESYLEGLDKP